MKKMLILFVIFISFIHIYAIKIRTLENENIDGEFISMTNNLFFLKINKKINKIPLSNIKDFTLTQKEKEKMFFTLKKNYTFKGYLIKIEDDFFTFKNKNSLFKIYKDEIKSIIIRER
ncbi:hypothetical protein, partial [Marinitoga arctica]